MSLKEIAGPLDETSRLPLYQQLQRAIRKAIEESALSPSDALPPERDIATEYDVSRITVRKALDGLVQDGLLARRQGAGTFVTAHLEKRLTRISSFSEDLAARGWVARSKVLERIKGTVTPEESLSLSLAPGEGVFRFRRIRYADDAPMAIETAVVPAFCLNSIEDVQGSLYDALERTGNRPVRALQRIKAVAFSETNARLLGITPGAPGLLLERRGFNAEGRAVEITQSYYRGDAYDFVVELTA
ncbi:MULTISPECIES: GntR family transcriptional regulator [Kordiimonadales]|uniref:GntR family transcriptional regulator n=1 Tax=Gimibacter soli TaxID=3024400 RepID=A0AAF0BH23_9PROT|nr:MULTISPECIES: GntR family transcriptional regulator [Kordiimonadales]WCL54073.1 GntR family transcriptional regulator [Gimibacter soli]